MPTPACSIVVPTMNRSEVVSRLLRRLAGECAGPQAFEVIVVDDGSTDATAATLSRGQWPFALRIVQQGNSGAAVARNAGARAASGDLLLFLDDDVEPDGGLVAAHATVHGDRHDIVAIGDLPPIVAGTGFMGVMLRAWWGAMQEAIRRPGHRHAFSDLLSGHFSIRRAQFERLGGFDERLRCREDYELGYRAIAAGLELRFAPGAVAWHHDRTDVRKAARRKFDEGKADVHLLQCHPELAPSLPLGHRVPRRRLERRLAGLAWTRPRAGDAVVRALTSMLTPLEMVRLRWRWQGLLNALLTYWYWRGVAQEAGSPAQLDRMMADVPGAGSSPPTIDLAYGLAAAEEQLDAVRPRAVRLVWGDQVIGEVADVPGTEPLAGRHLRPLLARSFRQEYVHALSEAGSVPPPLRAAAAAFAAQATARGSRGAAAV